MESTGVPDRGALEVESRSSLVADTGAKTISNNSMAPATGISRGRRRM